MFSSCPPQKLFNTALVSWNTTSAAIRCCLPELIPKPRKNYTHRGSLFVGLILAFIVDSGPVFRLSGNLHPRKRTNPHLFYSYGRVLGTHSVTVKHLPASADFAYWVIFLTFSSMMGRFFHFRFPKKIQPAFIKNKKKRRILRSSPLLSSGAHSKAVNKKKSLSKIIVCGPYS